MRWTPTRLGHVLRQRPRDVLVDPRAHYSFAGIKSFGGGVFRSVEKAGSAFSYRDLTRIRTGDLVYAKLMAWEGAISTVPPECDGCVVSPEFPVFEPVPGRADTRFIEGFFRTRSGQRLLLDSSTGTNITRRRVHPLRFLAMEIPLPPLEEQRRIAATIERILGAAQQATALGDRCRDEVVRLVVALAHRRDLSEAEKLDRGWRRASLADLMTQETDRVAVEAGRTYANLGIYSFARGLFAKPPIDGLHSSATTLNRARVGQFIYSRLFAFEGAYGMVDSAFDGWFVSNEYPTFRCDPKSTRPEFLVAYFKAPEVWRRVAADSRGLGNRRQRVQPEQLLSYRLWLPPRSWQDRVAEVLRRCERVTREGDAQSVDFSALMPAILERAFRGEL